LVSCYLMSTDQYTSCCHDDNRFTDSKTNSTVGK